ncbi:MAG: phosphoribosylamine--glycine ligase, partial [Ignavibacteriae bacterium]|nr:phosphoribosylamine--glycine ligase [Ignavibacteriota bacterium]
YAITGLENIDNEFTKIIHAGTTIENGKITTSGGRVLNVTTTLKNGSANDCLSICYQDISKVSYKDIYYRKDIGFKA